MGKGRRSLRLGWKLYLMRFFRMRTLVVFVLLFLAFDYNCMVMEQAVRQMDYPVSPWYVLNIMTDSFMCGVVGLSVVYLFAEAPYLNRNGMYQMVRCGKETWAAAQVVSIVFSSFTMTAGIFLMVICRMWGKLDWTADWGKMMNTMAQTNAATQFGIPFSMSYSFMQTMEGWQAGILAFVLDGLVFCLLGFLLFGIGLSMNRIGALAFTGFLAVLPLVEDGILPNWKYYFHIVSPVSWLRTGLFASKDLVYWVMPSVEMVFLFLGVYLGLSLCLVVVGVKWNRFDWNREE